LLVPHSGEASLLSSDALFLLQGLADRPGGDLSKLVVTVATILVFYRALRALETYVKILLQAADIVNEDFGRREELVELDVEDSKAKRDPGRIRARTTRAQRVT
jgi:hypothetical protein